LELSQIALSENLRPLIEGNPALEIVDGPAEIEFDGEGNLVDFRKVLSGGAEQKV
jgi:hypothetical protein